MIDGVRVLTTGRSLAGAYCAKLFADAGADVVLVEPPEGHPLRRWACRPDEARPGALFAYLAHGQRAVFDTDGPVAADLAATADLVVCDGDGDLVDPVALAAAHPGLVVVSISAYGLDGPFAGRPATELTVQADSGALGIRGLPTQPPVQAGGQVTEWVTGLYAAVAALAALRAARDTGRGELVDVSWAEVAYLTCDNFSDLLHELRGRPDVDSGPPPRTIETPSIEPTLDGYVGFTTNTPAQLTAFLQLIDRPDLIGNPAYASLTARLAHWDEWNAIVHAWTTRHTTAEIVGRATELRIPVAPVADAATLLALEHAVARGVFVDDPTGWFRLPRRPWLVDGQPAPAPRAAPGLGEHTGRIEPRSPRSSRADGPRHLPLEGLRVVDLTAWWAGPSCTGTLAALGADVIHVEAAARPDGMRLVGAIFLDQPQWWERSHFFLQANAGKRAVTLDLGTDWGRRVALELVAQADLVVENFTPRVLESFDLGWDVIHATNPRTVMVRMPAFGLDGPWRDSPGFAQTMEQLTGLAWLTGHVDDQPRVQRGPCDPNGGHHAAFAALAALERRDATGTGSLVEVPLFDAALAIAAEMVVEWTAYGHALHRLGNRSHRAAPQGVYACQGHERWLALSVDTDEHWTGLCGAVGRPDWAADPHLGSPAGRHEHHDQLDAHLAHWAADHDLDTAVELLVGHGVPAAAVRDPRFTAEHPQLRTRGFYEALPHPAVGALPTATVPFRFASVDRWMRRPAPTFGQHNDEVLIALGHADELAMRYESGDLATRPAGF